MLLILWSGSSQLETQKSKKNHEICLQPAAETRCLFSVNFSWVHRKREKSGVPRIFSAHACPGFCTFFVVCRSWLPANRLQGRGKDHLLHYMFTNLANKNKQLKKKKSLTACNSCHIPPERNLYATGIWQDWHYISTCMQIPKKRRKKRKRISLLGSSG